MEKNTKLYYGDCLEIMFSIPDKSIDMILCDLPYGTSGCKWDIIIPFDLLWINYNRIIKDIGAIVLFGSQPFTSKLIMSNLDMFKYTWVWIKNRSGNFINANNTPLKIHEDICVFSKGTCANKSLKRMNYNPQELIHVDKNSFRRQHPSSEIRYSRPSHKLNRKITKEGFPKDILNFNLDSNKYHPTQKPVKLLEYLIKTYTNENDIILDNCMGSGSTGVACINTNRKFIGIEKEEKYFKISEKRINETPILNKLF